MSSIKDPLLDNNMQLLKRDLFTEEELSGSNGKMDYSRLVTWFNVIASRQTDKIDQLTYTDLHRESGFQVPVDQWLTFMSDHRVSKLLDEIMMINARSSVNKLLNSDDKSVASSQKLSAMMNFISKHFDSIVGRDAIVYVYTSIPLTENEENSRNAKTLLIRPKVNPHNPATPGSKHNLTKGKV